MPAFLLLQRPIIVRCVKQGKIFEIFLGKWKLRNLLAGRAREVGGRLESGDNFFGTADLVFRSEDFFAPAIRSAFTLRAPLKDFHFLRWPCRIDPRGRLWRR